MTLLYIDGFAHTSGTTTSARYTGSSMQYGLTVSQRFPGTYYMGVNSNGKIRRVITPSAEVFAGFAFRPLNVASGAIAFYGDSAATVHLTLLMNNSGFLELRRGNSAGTLLATGTTQLTGSVWRYVEIRATIADSGGICQVRLDGSTTNEINYSGDTKNGGTSTNIDVFELGGNSNTGFTDLYVLNALGSVNNSWLGDVSIKVLVPNGAGTYTQFVPSTGSNHTCVDELPPSDTDYVGSANVGDKDTYTYADLPGTVTNVYGTQLAARMSKSDAGAKSAALITRSGGTDYTSSSIALGTSYAESLELRELDPATSSAWTASGVNSAEFGVTVAS